MSIKYGHDITIREVMNGFVVKVGCEHIVIEADSNGMESAVDGLCDTLKRYLKNRNKEEKGWYQTFRPNRVEVVVAEQPVTTVAEAIDLP